MATPAMHRALAALSAKQEIQLRRKAGAHDLQVRLKTRCDSEANHATSLVHASGYQMSRHISPVRIRLYEPSTLVVTWAPLMLAR